MKLRKVHMMPAKRTTQRGGTRRAALIWGLAGIVHCLWAPGSFVAAKRSGAQQRKSAQEPPQTLIGRGVAGLPPAVADMRSAIIAAIETGDIAELKSAMELNELPPDLGQPKNADPIQYLRSLSVDGTGKDVLVGIARLLEGSWAAIPGGRDIENNRIYVWPHFAEVPLERLSDEERGELAALIGEAQSTAVIAARRYRGWRLSIGADGVWHMLARID